MYYAYVKLFQVEVEVHWDVKGLSGGNRKVMDKRIKMNKTITKQKHYTESSCSSLSTPNEELLGKSADAFVEGIP